jgi:hypothetical protein
MEQLAKGQPVTFNVIGVQPVAGIYAGAVKVSARYPTGGHRVELYGQPGVRVVVKNAPTVHPTIADALAVVAASYGV